MATTSPPLTRTSVQEARALIKPHIHLTPLLTCSTLNRIASTPRSPDSLSNTPWAGRSPANPTLRFHFKCENLQKIGAFKARGAFHAVERLQNDPEWVSSGGREKGVVTHSSGMFTSLFKLSLPSPLCSASPISPLNPSNQFPSHV